MDASADVVKNGPGESVDTLDVPDGYELVDGQLREMAVGAKSSWVGGRLFARLDSYCERQNLGWAFPQETAYRCFGTGHTVRKPDASFIGKGRLKGEELPEGDLRIYPDLAVESVSLNDTVYELDDKIEEYLEAGVRLVWVINPKTRIAVIHRADGTMAKVREDQELSGEDVVPGFRCRLSDVLPPVPAPAP
jgi:Uma2 family endonuclease